MENPKADAGSQAASAVGPDAVGQGADDLFATDEFRMYAFKILPCARRTSHDWTTCPFAHPGEKARRRDPRLFSYLAVPCPDVKQNQPCPRGDSCQYCHSVFEYWLHPSRYRTQLCQNGAHCRRTVCFFAHSVSDLRTDPSHLNLSKSESDASGHATAAAADAAAAKGADGTPAASSGGSSRRSSGPRLERSQSESVAVLALHAHQQQVASPTTTTSGSLPSAKPAPSSPGAAAVRHTHAAARTQAQAQAQAEAAARLRRDSAPTQLMGGVAASPASMMSAYDMYLSGGCVSGASRSLSLPATPHLLRAQSLGAAYGAHHSAATPWHVAPMDELGALCGAGWWPPRGQEGAPGQQIPCGSPAHALDAASVYARLAADPASAAAAYLEDRALIEEHAVAAAAIQAALTSAPAASAACGLGGFASDPGYYGDSSGYGPPLAQQQQQQVMQLQHVYDAIQQQQQPAPARSMSSDASSVAAALALAGSCSMDSSSGTSFSLAPGTPSAHLSPSAALGCLGLGPRALHSQSGPPVGRRSCDLQRGGSEGLFPSAAPGALSDCASLGGMQLSDSASGPESPLMKQRSVPLPAPPMQQDAPSGSPQCSRLGMLSPMAAPSRDSVIRVAGSTDTLQQHLAMAGLGGGSPAPTRDQEGEALLRGIVDALMQQLQQQQA